MWPVWNTTRMQRDRRTFNASTAAKVAIDIVDHLIAIDVAMIIWHWDREWMIIQFTRYKGTDYEVWPLEGLMYWRRLVDAPGDGLKVANIEDPGILAAIPAHGINGMEVKPVTRDHVGHLDTDLVIASFDVRYKLFRPANVAFAVGGVLQHLAVLIKITARWLDSAMGFNRQEACSGAIGSDLESEGRPPRNNDVVSFVIGKQTEVRLEHSMPIVDEVDQVRVAVAIEVVHSHRGLRDANGHIFIEHEHLVSQDGITTTRELGGSKVMMPLYLFLPFILWVLYNHELLYFFDSRRRIVIVKIGIVTRKAFGAEEFLGVESSVWFAELCMTLRGYLPQTMISWHSALLIRRFDSAIRQYLQFPIRLRHHAGTRGEPRYPTQAGSPFRQCRNRARLQHEGGHCEKPGRSSVESCSISG